MHRKRGRRLGLCAFPHVVLHLCAPPPGDVLYGVEDEGGEGEGPAGPQSC